MLDQTVEAESQTVIEIKVMNDEVFLMGLLFENQEDVIYY